jgi:hypothetical protein
VTPRAVVFGYHDVGDRCLRALVSQGWDVPLLVTHDPDPDEPRWYADVAETANDHDIPVLRPAPSQLGELERTLSQIRPDFIFSFYYRAMLSEALLQRARRGALNMHGSLLPKYRGRAPVNWAILNGERETGATLHYMSARADAGDIVDQLAVPILADAAARGWNGAARPAAGFGQRLPWSAIPGRWAHRLELACGTDTQPRARSGAAVSRCVRRSKRETLVDSPYSARPRENRTGPASAPLRRERPVLHRVQRRPRAATDGRSRRWE